MAGFGAQQWAAFAAMSGQPNVGNTQTFQLGGVDSNGMVLGAMGPGYVRIGPDSSQPSVMSASSLHGPPNPYGSHPNLGYTLQPSIENASRQIPSGSVPPYLQHYHGNGPVTQPIPFPHASLPYGQSFPYIQPLLPGLCNGINQLTQCQTIPQQQAALVSGYESSLRVLDSLKSFVAMPHDQNRRSKSMITSKTNLYISGLNESDTDETVRSLVGDVVTPKSCKAMMNNGVCKGYGFIDCATEEDAEKAKNYILNNANTGGRKLLVKFAHENEKDVLNVYVRHLPADFTKEKLESLFHVYGEITSVKLLENEDRLTGIGFVRFARPEQAERAIEDMNAERLYLGGNTAPVVCKLADKPNARRRLVNPTHPTTALMSLPPLTNTVQRHSMSFGGPNSQRIPTAAALSQSQSNFNPAVPFNTQLISPLNQPQVILHNLQGQSISPHAAARAMLPAAPCPIASNRATPLITASPSAPIFNLQANQNAAAVTSNSPTSKYMNAAQETATSYACETAPMDKLRSCDSPTVSQHLVTQAMHINQVAALSNNPAFNQQLLVFPQSSCAGTIPNPSSSVFPYFPTYVSQSSQPPTPAAPLSVTPVQLPNMNNHFLAPLDQSTVTLFASEMQALSLKSSEQQQQQQQPYTVDGSFFRPSVCETRASDPGHATDLTNVASPATTAVVVVNSKTDMQTTSDSDSTRASHQLDDSENVVGNAHGALETEKNLSRNGVTSPEPEDSVDVVARSSHPMQVQSGRRKGASDVSENH